MRTPTLPTGIAVLALAIPALAIPGATTAQVANPLAQSVGMGGNYTALARGLAAPAWNPAGLGMPDNPGMSFTVLPFNVTAGLSPITPGDLAEYDGEFIPRETRLDWLSAIADQGGETGSVGGDVTYAAFSVGQFALSASSSVRGRANVAPDVAEVFFFGNAGLTGDPGDYTLSGSNFDVAGTSTLAASMALPLSLTLGPLPDQHFSVGATLKYTMGNFLVLGQENQSSLESDPIAVDVRFPMVHTAMPDDSVGRTVGDVLNNGHGFGVDLGAAWQGGIFSAGLKIENLINTFEWDLDDLQFREGTATWNADTSYTSFEEGDVANAPAELIDRIESLYTFSPTVAAGAAARVLPFLTVTGELRHSLEDNLHVGAQNHVGVGAELTIVPTVPVRAGLAAISGGYQLSGGLGVKLGPVQLSVSAAHRETELGGDALGAVGLTVGVR